MCSSVLSKVSTGIVGNVQDVNLFFDIYILAEPANILFYALTTSLVLNVCHIPVCEVIIYL